MEFYEQGCKASFVTLTYAEENLRFSSEGQPSLCKRDVQLWLKKVRKRFGQGIRFYAAGEYGSKTRRPHYHVILYGLAPDDLDSDWFYFGGKSGPFKPNYCRDTPLYQTWKFGVVHVGEVTTHSIQYVAGYVTKKLLKKEAEKFGLIPEFALMSRKPGIGIAAVSEIARSLQKLSKNSPAALPSRELVVDGKRWPIGRYLLHKLAIVSDISSGFEEYYRTMSDAYRESVRKRRDFLEYLIETDDQAFANLEAKEKLFHEREDL